MTGIRIPLTGVPRAFRNLDSLVLGNEVSLSGTRWRRYAFEAYEHPA